MTENIAMLKIPFLAAKVQNKAHSMPHTPVFFVIICNL